MEELDDDLDVQKKGEDLCISTAVVVGGVRLIDNIVLATAGDDVFN